MCNIITFISSEPINDTYLPINKAVTNGTVAIGKVIINISYNTSMTDMTYFFKELVKRNYLNLLLH